LLKAETRAGGPAPHAGIKKPPLQGDQPIPPKRAPTLAETASRVREQEVFGCYFPLYSTKHSRGSLVLQGPMSFAKGRVKKEDKIPDACRAEALPGCFASKAERGMDAVCCASSPTPPGTIATAPPRAIKQNAVRWLLFFLIAAASSLNGRCRLRRDVRRPVSPKGCRGTEGGNTIASRAFRDAPGGLYRLFWQREGESQSLTALYGQI
jgi:hypothetical protein